MAESEVKNEVCVHFTHLPLVPESENLFTLTDMKTKKLEAELNIVVSEYITKKINLGTIKTKTPIGGLTYTPDLQGFPSLWLSSVICVCSCVF